MLQRLNLVATTALLVAVLFFGFRSYSMMETVAELATGIEQRVVALEGDRGSIPVSPDYLVAGAVARPGEFACTDDLTLWDAVMLAEPIEGGCDLTRVGLSREVNGEPVVLLVDVQHVKETGDTSMNVKIRPGDVIRVPSRTPVAPQPVVVELGDSIEVVSTYHPDELNATEALAGDGTVLLREIGHVLVAGLTRDEVEATLKEKYAPYYDSLDLHVKVHKGR